MARPRRKLRVVRSPASAPDEVGSPSPFQRADVPVPPWAWALALAALVALSRVPAFRLAGDNALFIEDETEMALSVSDRFLGVPSMSLAWPGGTMQLLSLPGLGLDYLMSGDELGPKGFAQYLADNYEAPWHWIRCFRLFNMLLAAAAFGFLFWALASHVGNRAVTAALTLAAATLPDVWLASTMATPDGTAASLGFAAFAAVFVPLSPVASMALAGAIFGLGVAAKLSLVPLGFLLAIGGTLEREGGRRALFAFLGAAAIGFLIGCPYLWVDPVRLAKSVLGNLLRGAHGVGMVEVLWATLRVVPVFLFAVACGLWMDRRRVAWATGLGVTLVVGSFLLGRSTLLLERYLLGIEIAVVATSFIALRALHARLVLTGRMPMAHFAWLATGVVLFIAVTQTVRYRGRIHDFGDGWNATRAAAKAVREGSGALTLVPFHLLYFTLTAASAADATALADATAAAVRDGDAIRRFAESRGLPAAAMTGMWTAFSEDEQALIARMRLVAAHRPSGDRRIAWFAVDDPTARRTGLPGIDEAEKRFLEGWGDRLLTPRRLAGRTPAHVFGDLYYLYERTREPAER